MAHIRQQIRNAFANALDGLTITGANVFIARVEPIEMENTPALVINTLEDEMTSASGYPPRTVHRLLTVQVEGYAQLTGAVVDTLDAIAAEVETAIINAYKMGGLLKDCWLDSTEISLSGESATPNGHIIMKFLVKYHHKENAPETAT